MAAVLDIVIIAAFIYVAMVLFRKAKSFFILFGIGLIGLLYGLALVLDLYLTRLVLQGFFTAIFVVLVVLFQEELRRFFEHVANVGTRLQRSKRQRVTAPTAIQEIAQAIAKLQQQRMGALIVFPGSENIERHIHGGRLLDGMITEELLLSLFDPTTPGHDGAVIVQNGRIARFGVHLPLSENLEEVAKRGTRHTAALGLSELSDALVVVVSEERGTVSIAKDGALEAADDSGTLISALKRFTVREGDRGEKRTLKRLIFANVREKMLALGAAALLWFLVAFPAGTVQRDFVAPVSFQNLPATLTIVETDPKEITVALAARGRTPFDDLDSQAVAVLIDGRVLEPGMNEIVIQENMVRRPTNISVVNLSPNRIRVRVEVIERPAPGAASPTRN